MNIYAIIILTALCFDFILNLIADILNLGHLQPELPGEFSGVFDEASYRKSQEYTRVKTFFGIITSSFSLLVTLAFWFAKGFQYLDNFIRGWQLNALWTGLIYIGILLFFRSILFLPFSIYSTFVIEEKFGFNKTTLKTFITDILKGLFLSIVIGAPLLLGILAFFQYSGSLAWLFCWIATTVFSIILQFIAPTWIMPLFNKFTPLEDGELLQRIKAYTANVRFPHAGVFIMDGSKRSSKSNAFFTGFGKTKRIALYDTLVEKHTTPELIGILAHEIGHYKKKHIITNMILGILHAGVIFYLLSIFVRHTGLFQAFYVETPSIYAGLIFFGLLFTPLELVLSFFLSLRSRKNEYQADQYAVETTQESSSFISALKKLSHDNLSNLTPHPFYVMLNYSHPPVLQRIRAIKNQ
jgi:STE24 endopeptidase